MESIRQIVEFEAQTGRAPHGDCTPHTLVTRRHLQLQPAQQHEQQDPSIKKKQGRNTLHINTLTGDSRRSLQHFAAWIIAFIGRLTQIGGCGPRCRVPGSNAIMIIVID